MRRLDTRHSGFFSGVRRHEWLGQLCEIRRDFGVLRISVERARVPASRFLDLSFFSRYVAEMAKNNQVLGIERERLLKNTAGFVDAAGVVECLTIHDVATHVSGLLRKVCAANRNRLLGVTRFAILVGKRRKVTPRIFVELLLQLVNPR